MPNAEETTSRLAERRREKVALVLANPENFMVCEGCGGLSHRVTPAVGRCRICGAYRWDTSPERVLSHVNQAAERDIGLTMPYLPRNVEQVIP
jgi:hypothetical protein